MPTLQNLTKKLNLNRFEPGVWAAAGIQSLGYIGYSTSFTYLPLYYYQERGLSMTLVGLLLLIPGAVAACTQVLGGMMADRFGYRRIVVLFKSAGIIASAVLAVLISLKAPLWSVVLMAILVPALDGMAGPSILAIVADVSPKNRMTESYGLMAIAGNIDWAIGPFLGGFLLKFVSYGWLFGIGTFLSVFALTCIPFLPAGHKTGDSERLSINSLKLLVSNSTLVIFSLLSLLFFLTMSQWGSTLSVFTVDRIGFSTEQYGLLMSLSGILIVVFQYPVTRQIQRLGTRKALVFGSILYAVGFLSFTWVKTPLPAVGSIIILVTGEMLFVPTAFSVVGQISRPEERGKTMGFYQLFNMLGMFSGPLLGGFLLDQFPKTPLFVWLPISLCSFIAALGFAVWRGYSETKTIDDIKPPVPLSFPT